MQKKTLKDLEGKVPADLKQKVEDAATKVREVKDGDDANAINTAADQLTEVLQQLGQAAYQQQQAAGEAPTGEADGGDKAPKKNPVTMKMSLTANSNRSDPIQQE